ncbi:hypothetical protein DAPPUDRAFT_233568 [Daphnia pulex]|uniref:Uncharacterized protein n=1 Tax=Daphnia pulex TaxID=6669 RepID=E9FV54_DAPPU|nr:hypothetical protein DAPPUDRAFT_233568 [Daphnia pulex]|eukprot:EFX89166.1 hypothetical protein DAPPUDRAFT_233568 [Daphnia pulex]
MKFPRIFQFFYLLAIGGYSSSSSSKLRDRWHTVSSFPALATNLIRRIASSKQTQGINLSERDSPTGSRRYVISDESPTYITPSLSPTADGRGTYKVRDMSTDWLAQHGSQLPDVTGLFNDPYDTGEDGTTALLADVHRHSSLIKTIVPAPPSLYLPAVMRGMSDSYLRELEFLRVPCQMLEDPSDCDGYSLLFKQSIAGSFLRECEIDKSHNAQKTRCDPLLFPADFSEYRLLRLIENFLLQKPIMLLSPNNIEFTLRNIRSNQHTFE